MPITFVILLGLVVAVVGGVLALATGHRRAGVALIAAGLLLTAGLSLLLYFSLQTM